MTETICLRCLTAGRHTPVTLTADAYHCPVCGFTAQVRRVKLSDILWGRTAGGGLLEPGRGALY